MQNSAKIQLDIHLNFKWRFMEDQQEMTALEKDEGRGKCQMR